MDGDSLKGEFVRGVFMLTDKRTNTRIPISQPADFELLGKAYKEGLRKIEESKTDKDQAD